MPKTEFTGFLTVTEKMRVPFNDVDSANVVWHGRYFKYFEEVRRTLLEDLDYSYAAMLESGYLWPVVDASIRYVRPLLLDQYFVVTAAMREWEMRMVIDYRIHDLDGVLYTKGRTVQVPVDAKTKEMYLGAPDDLLQKIERRLAKGV
ncbi:MAG: acyl-CoA thioesterase [Gammaproteobacteria bacterium]|nr:acyl-CoA thioesterase [Gammaproteobacteria bacterium]